MLQNYLPAKTDDSKPASVKSQSKRARPRQDAVAVAVDIKMTEDDLFEEVEEFEVDHFDLAVKKVKSDLNFE